jgi:intracellular septation protein
MKLLLDFLPIVLFFVAFKYGTSNKDWASSFASEHLGFMVSGGTVGPAEAPVLLATVVVIAATLAQVLYLKARRKKVDVMLWVSLGLVTVLGGATIWFHSEAFIKWKPSVLYWVMAAAFWVSQTFMGKNLLQILMGSQLTLPAPVWKRLGLAWAAFFTVMGGINLYVAYHFDTETWVNFKLFGGMGLMLVFTLAQGIYLSKHIQPEDTAANDASAQTPVGKP